jgi:hypothetical protein
MANRWDCLTNSERFWSHVPQPRIEGACWEWDGAKSLGGYGMFIVHVPKRRCMNAHRFAYIDRFGDIPTTMHVDHVCRNRACVNPAHLRLLTNKNNVLFGTGPTAINARKTHCKYGHLLSGKNLYIRKNGYRNCKECRREASNRARKQT